MVRRRAAIALITCVAAVVGAAPRGVGAAAVGRAPGESTDVAADAPSPYEETLAREGARLGAQAGGPQAVGALAELAWLDENVSPAALEAAVRRGLGPGAHPLVAAQAAFLLAHLLDERGATEEATSLRARLGLLTHAFVIGPFGEGTRTCPICPAGTRRGCWPALLSCCS